jgi:hypothetical protein
VPFTLEEFTHNVHDQRFLLAVRTFRFDINYVTIQLSREAQDRLLNFVVTAILGPLSGLPDVELQALQVVPHSNPAEVQPREGGERAFFSIAYGSPVYDFQLLMGPDNTPH